MNKKECIITLVITIAILFFSALTVFGSNETNLTNNNVISADDNQVRPLTLSEQKNQVQEAIAATNERLSYVSGELSDTAIEIQSLNDKIDGYKIELDKVNKEYDNFAIKIAETEAELTNIEEKYNRKNELFKKRMVALYKRGNLSYLDVLLSSTNIVDFVSNYFIVQEIAEYDTEDLRELADYSEQLKNTQITLNIQKEKLKKLKEDADTQMVLVQNAQVLVQNYMKSLSSSEKELVTQINTYKMQEQEIEGLIANAMRSSNYELTYSGGVMAWPTYSTSYITSPFGSRLHPIQGVVKDHDGIDIGGRTGDSIYAAADGIVIYAAWLGGYGNAIMLDNGLTEDGKRLVTLYGHGSEFVSQVGDRVTKGQEIMKMGSTGNSTGPHVHFETRENNVPVDPKKYLSDNYVAPVYENEVERDVNDIIDN